MAEAVRVFTRAFGMRPAGCWPSEGAVSDEALALIERHGFSWAASSAGVLAGSLPGAGPHRPYRLADGQLDCWFRDDGLSDLIGFSYAGWHGDDAVAHFVASLAQIAQAQAASGRHAVLVALVGENAWGGYPDDGRPFLHALYGRLASSPRFRTVTFSEYLFGNPARGIRPHPLEGLAPVRELATGSWIEEPGSDAGVDVGTWIGGPEENAAWTLLGAARSTLIQAATITPEVDHAHVSLMAAEGSDWFWWFGSDQESRNDASFDELFRAHLRGVYHALGADPPAELDEAIVPHPVVWTFAHPVSRIGRRDQLTVRTNCPGRLTFRV